MKRNNSDRCKVRRFSGSALLLTTLLLTAVTLALSADERKVETIDATATGTSTQLGQIVNVKLLCQQYVLRSGTTDYTIRQPKPSDQAFIPLNTAVQFTLDKSKMKFKVNGKSLEFLVVGQAAASSAPPASSAPNR